MTIKELKKGNEKVKFYQQVDFASPVYAMRISALPAPRPVGQAADDSWHGMSAAVAAQQTSALNNLSCHSYYSAAS